MPSVRLVGFDKQRALSPAVEAFIRDVFDASHPLPFQNASRTQRMLADIEAVVEVFPEHGGIKIETIQALSRRKGEGTKALRFLTDLADKHGVSLYLYAKPFGDEAMDLDDLVRFYRRFGFRQDEEGDEEEDEYEGVEMHRWPRETLRSNPRRGLDVRPGIPGTYRTQYTAKGGKTRAYPAHGGAAWDRTMTRVASETTVAGGRIYDTVKRAERAGRAMVRGKRGAVEVERVTNPISKDPYVSFLPDEVLGFMEAYRERDFDGIFARMGAKVDLSVGMGAGDLERGVSLDEIRVTKKRAGVGTRAMIMLTDLADEFGVPMFLYANPLEGNISVYDLAAFYRGFGFEESGEGGSEEDEDEDTGVVMVRYPEPLRNPRRRR